ncbi:protein dead ringer homolog [Antedon mediterranea]|uniref:protein dead ringer homolog n=1 Tax=Antedon mediterranea TaxID=105859 RepID=UPI003AF812A5
MMESAVNGRIPPPVLIPVASYGNGRYIPKHYHETRETFITSYKRQRPDSDDEDSDTELNVDQPTDLSLTKEEVHPRNGQITPPLSHGERSPAIEDSDSLQQSDVRSPYQPSLPSHNKSPDMGNSEIPSIPSRSPRSPSCRSPYQHCSDSPYRRGSVSPRSERKPNIKQETDLDFDRPSMMDEPTDLSLRDVETEDKLVVDGEENSSLSDYWSFEEQFKQLYELTDDPARKVFLDKLFLYMQKRGTPVNRIPIMAKQVLDLYELFQLVTSKGGLVEVINKKMWREITKGLNLPSSITSAAFTLRTQYMKYLYPYECETKGLSTPSELQVAIDNNRREGRRSYQPSAYVTHQPHSPPPSMIPMAKSIPLTHPGFYRPQRLPGFIPSNLSSSGDEESQPPTPSPQSVSKLHHSPLFDHGGPLPPKRSLLSDEAYHRFVTQQHHLLYPSTHLKITSSKSEQGSGLPMLESRSDNSMVISMEINGILYQGVLYPHAVTSMPHHRTSLHNIK